MAKKYHNVKRIFFEIAEPGDKDCVDVQFPAELSKRIEVMNPKSFSMSNQCDKCKRRKSTGKVAGALGAMLRGAGIHREA